MYQYRVLPCPHFGLGDFQIILRHGFLTYPSFIDNGFKTQEGLKWEKAVKNAIQFHPIFFIANDNEPLTDLDILRKHVANIILPLHYKEDLEKYFSYFDWIGFPNNPKLRDYKIDWFIKNTPGKLRWWLGLHEYPVNDPLKILKFHGLDSTLPELYAGKYGKVWTNWRQYYKPKNRLHWRVIFEMNVQNFALFLNNLTPSKQMELTQFEMIETERNSN